MTATVVALAPRRSAVSSSSAGTITGTAIVYNEPAIIHTPYGAFREAIAPGALRSVLAGPGVGDIALLRDHMSSLLLGRHRSGTLELRDGAAGLRIRASLPATELGHETYHLIDRGDLRGMSFAFAVAADGDSWFEERGKPPLRLIVAIDTVYEVSVVAFPAYASTVVATDARARTPMAMRARLCEDLMAATGGSVTPGRRVGPPPALREWLSKYRVRIGTRAVAA